MKIESVYHYEKDGMFSLWCDAECIEWIQRRIKQKMMDISDVYKMQELCEIWIRLDKAIKESQSQGTEGAEALNDDSLPF